MKLGFIGTGAITEAIVTGLLASDFAVEEMLVSERNRAVSARLARASDRVRVFTDNQDIVDGADLVILAIRPQDAQAVISALRFGEGQRLCSLVATVPAETLRDWIGTRVDIFRSIPLPSVAERRGVTALFPDDPVGEEIFASLGEVVSARSLDEFDAFAVASALMGTYFGLLETATDWMCSTGLDRDSAKSYLDGVFLGLAQRSVSAGADSYAELRADHSTPGGLNEQMFDVFSSSGGSDALASALESVAHRVRIARSDAE